MLTGCSSSLFDRVGNDRYERGRSYPASARVDTRNGEPRYRVCHDGRDTRTVRERDVESHLRHGDRFGACNDARRDDRRDDRYRSGSSSYPRWAREVSPQRPRCAIRCATKGARARATPSRPFEGT